MTYLLICLIAYLVGSIPFGLLLGFLFKHKDIRQFGTKNAGASNTFLVLGPIAAILTALFDIAKGFFPVFITWQIYNDESIACLAGFCAFLGHVWPIFFKFKGGKGIATAFGSMLSISMPLTFLGLFLWLIILSVWHYVALSNVSAFILMPLIFFISGLANEYVIFAILIAVFLIFSHRENFAKYFQGKEPTLIDYMKKKV